MNNFWFSLVSGVAAMLAIGVLSVADHSNTGLVWLIAPFGATTVLVFGVPDSPLAQPKNVIFGHLLSALIGVLFVEFIGVDTYTVAVATGLAVFTMLLTGTTHPPAGANPLLVMLSGQSWGFLFTPVLAGAVVIVALGWVVRQSRKRWSATVRVTSGG